MVALEPKSPSWVWRRCECPVCVSVPELPSLFPGLTPDVVPDPQMEFPFSLPDIAEHPHFHGSAAASAEAGSLYPDSKAQSYNNLPDDGDYLHLASEDVALQEYLGEYDQPSHGGPLGLQSHFLAPPGPVEVEERGGVAEEVVGSGFTRNHGGIQLQMVCPGYAVYGECECGDEWAKEIICAREWCVNCGGDGGAAHQRRKVRWFPRAMQMASIGYFVITIPPELRAKFRDLEVLRAFGKSIKRAMKYHGFDRGLRSWHWFGEDHPGHGLQGDGLPNYSPHLNLLVPGGFLPMEKIEAVKQSVATILGVSLSRVNIHYSFADTPAEMLHLVKYVLRPTFEDWRWDPEMAARVLGFRHRLHWGTWNDEPVWSMGDGDEVAVVGLLEKGFCPLDGTPITWRGVKSVALLSLKEWEGVGGGYHSWKGATAIDPPD